MAIRATDVIILRGPAVEAAGGNVIPSGRRKDTKHIYLPGLGGAHSVRADVNENYPLPVFGYGVEITGREGGMFPKLAMTPGAVKKLSWDFDASRPRR